MAIPKIASYAIPTAMPDNRAQWSVNPERAVLLVHDLQKYFVDFYEPSQDPIKTVLTNIQKLKTACKQNGIPVVYSAQPARQKQADRALLTDFWGHGVQEDAAVEVVTQLAPEADDLVLTKWRYSAFQRTQLQAWMQAHNKDQLIICGVYAHIGILSTVLEAFMNDMQCFVVQDAVADFSLADHQMAMQYIAGRCGYVTHAQALLQYFNPLALSLEQLKNDVAECLAINPNDIAVDDNLMDWGLDSIRLMSLVEQWRAQVPSLQFEHLAESATLQDWAAIIAGAKSYG